MSEERVQRRLAAILAVDIAGYSRLMGEDEEGTLAALKAIRRELGDPKIVEHRGRIVKTTGDGLLVEFASVVDAVRCAVEVQREMTLRNSATPAHRRIEFRMGINVGDIIIEDGDIFGDGVNIAARLERLAEPGGICLSAAAHEQVRDRLDIAFNDLGEQQVKNIARPVRVFRVTLAHPAATAPGSPLSRNAGEDAERQPREAGEGKQALPLPDKPSLAVLPFQNMTGDAEQEYFVDGMVEEITTAIARLPWLFVIARNSAFTYKGKPVDMKRVAQELGVRYVLEGSVRKAGNRVRITGQLIDTASGAHIWADRFDGALDDIFELQDQVASSVAGVIEPKLRQSEIERASRKPTANLTAYDLYLRALAQFHKVELEGYEQAFNSAVQALAIDPSYAPAAALASSCRTWQTAQGWIRNSPEIASEALRLASRATDTGKDDPDVLWMAAHTIGQFTGDVPTALRAVERALALNPNGAYAWAIKGWLNLYIDRPEAAIDALDRARRLSPLDPMGYLFTMGLARAHLTAGRYPEAMQWADSAIAEAPRLTMALRIKVVLCELMGRHDEARELVAQLHQAAPDMTVESFVAYSARHYTTELRMLFVDALRKAGLPEE